MKPIVTALAALSFAAAPVAAQVQAAETDQDVPEVAGAGVAQGNLPVLPASQIPAGAVIVGGLVILGGVVIAIAAGDDGTPSTPSTPSTD